MKTESLKKGSQEFAIPVLAGLALGFQVLLRNANILTINFDGWSYWEGAISLANGRGYVDLLGNPITAWPPLMSLYLAVFASGSHLSLGGIKLALVILAFISGLVWGLLARNEFAEESRFIRSISIIYVVLIFPPYFDWLLSEPLWIPLSGLLLLLAIYYRSSPLFFVATTTVMAACLFTRNQSVVFVPCLLAFLSIRSGIRQAIRFLLPLVSALFIWVLYRLISPQSNSHDIGPKATAILSDLSDALLSTADQITYTKAGIPVVVMGCLVFFIGSVLCRSFPRGSVQPGVSEKARKSASWLLFSSLFWLTSFLLAYITSVPPAQPRFYVFSLISILFASLWAVSLAPRDSSRRAASLVLVLATSAMLYRGIYFINHRITMEPGMFSNSFSVSKAWIQSAVSQIDDSVNGGVSIESASSRFGISPNRYRAWKGIPLQ